jgi:Xaa-Pro aminopeptidase
VARVGHLLLLLGAIAAAGPAPLDPVEARKLRRERVARAIGADYAFLFGQPFTDVLQPPQEGSFLYLTGVDEAGAALLLAGERAPTVDGARTALFLRDMPPRVARFFGVRLLPGVPATAALGVEGVRASPGDGAGFALAVAKLLPRNARLRLPAYADGDGVTLRDLRAGFLAELGRARPDVEVVDLGDTIDRLRAVKDALEIDALRRAVALTLAALCDALPAVRPGSTEAQVHGELLRGVRARGAWPAFDFVVASGRNATVPHHFRNDGPLLDGDLVVIDAGASVDRYAADVTRTFPVSGRFTPRQREVYCAVLAAQRAGIAAIRPGATFRDVDAAARDVLAEAGLLAFVLHGTCHHVGLNVHDPGPIRIEPGMTFAVEPGVYIESESLGVRIEDVVLVTQSGVEVLSDGFPREPDAIEALFAR